MGKKKLYMVLDTETATLPFVKDFDESTRKDIAIAKPLVYDLGWTIVDRKGNVYDKRNYLIQETFFVPNIFNTAYYKDKRLNIWNCWHKARLRQSAGMTQWQK